MTDKCEEVNNFKVSARVLICHYTERISREMLEDAARDSRETIEMKALTGWVKRMMN